MPDTRSNRKALVATGDGNAWSKKDALVVPCFDGKEAVKFHRWKTLPLVKTGVEIEIIFQGAWQGHAEPIIECIGQVPFAMIRFFLIKSLVFKLSRNYGRFYRGR